ncbi:hypothetical protein GZH82_04130 [Staphylococcus ursi]|uniref:hypothetical protein n=1 Tax=Staphylococcus sp. MI 10-1553 TaxID=1912064 RepID=UPI0013978AFC|nr:hypothetical protein [Staphylococcus sp. MI 10-1553]QHW36610.1 hypothetical protein GZH82_04130 [Staphylococcus sp. MI 10-1553]
MNKLFKVSALSISLGLAGLVGTNVQAAEEAPATQSDDFDATAYNQHKNLSSQYDALRQRQAQEQQNVHTTSTKNDDFDVVAYNHHKNLSSQYDVLRESQAAQHQKEIQNN